MNGKVFFGSRERERELKITFTFYEKGMGIKKLHFRFFQKGNGIFQRERKGNLRLLFPGMAGNGNGNFYKKNRCNSRFDLN